LNKSEQTCNNGNAVGYVRPTVCQPLD